MLLLALDTSSAAVTAAVYDGDRVLGEQTRIGAQAHGELLAPVVAAALAGAGASPGDLTGIVVGVGPGPFTGLRVGIVLGKIMGAALGIPVTGVCSLDALAWLARDEMSAPFAVATDARRREVYLATYDDGGRRLAGPDVLRPVDVAPEVRLGPVVGAGAALHADAFTDVRGPSLVTGAAVAAYAIESLRAGAPALEPVPMYLRRPDAVPSVSPKRVGT